MNVLWGTLTHGERQNILWALEKASALVHAMGLLPKWFRSVKGIDLSFLFQSSLASASFVPAIAVVKPCCQMNQKLKIYLYFTLLQVNVSTRWVGSSDWTCKTMTICSGPSKVIGAYSWRQRDGFYDGHISFCWESALKAGVEEGERWGKKVMGGSDSRIQCRGSEWLIFS